METSRTRYGILLTVAKEKKKKSETLECNSRQPAVEILFYKNVSESLLYTVFWGSSGLKYITRINASIPLLTASYP